MRVSSEKYEFSHTEMQAFKTCRRKHYLGYYLKLKRKKNIVSVPRSTGILVHSSLDTYYKMGRGDFAIQQMKNSLAGSREEDIANAQAFEIKDLEESYTLAEIIVDGYIDWLNETGADLPFEWGEPEQKLQVDGPIEGTVLKGYLDMSGVHKQSGDLVVLDHKVVQNPNEIIKTLHLNEQAPTYAILSKLNQPDSNRGFRVIWNFLKKTKRGPRSTPPFYSRYEFALNPAMLETFWLQLHGTMYDILQSEKRLDAGESHQVVSFPTPGKDCTWSCDYYSVCGLMNDPRSDPDFMLQQYFEVRGHREDKVPEVEDVVE